MWKKYLSLQYWVDALFDEGWCSLGLPEGLSDDAVPADAL